MRQVQSYQAQLLSWGERDLRWRLTAMHEAWTILNRHKAPGSTYRIYHALQTIPMGLVRFRRWTVPELARETGCSEKTVSETLSWLFQEGLLKLERDAGGRFTKIFPRFKFIHSLMSLVPTLRSTRKKTSGSCNDVVVRSSTKSDISNSYNDRPRSPPEPERQQRPDDGHGAPTPTAEQQRMRIALNKRLGQLETELVNQFSPYWSQRGPPGKKAPT